MNRRQYLQRLLVSSCSASFVGHGALANEFFQPEVGCSIEPDALHRLSSAEDWPDFLGPQRNGVCAQKIELRDWSQLPLLWQLPLGEGYTIGSCRGDLFVQTDRQRDQERTIAVHAHTGEVQWTQQRPTSYQDMYGYDGGPRCSPVFSQEAVFTYGVDGVLIARDWRDGRLLWERDLNRDYHVVQNFFGVGSTPALFGDRLWVMVGGSPAADLQIAPGALNRVSSAGSAMVALDCRTGETLLEVGDDLASYSSPVIVNLPAKSTPTTSAERAKSATQGITVLLAFCRAGLLCLDPTAGTQHFHFPFRSSLLESVNAATPVVVGRQVLLSETYSVGSLLLELDPENLQQPKVIWQDEPNARDQSLQSHWNTPIYHDGYLYASSGRNTGNAELRCVEWVTGKVLWRQPGLTRCTLTKAAGDDLVVVSERGDLFLIQATPDGYRPVTSHRFAQPGLAMRYPAWAGAALAQGKMFCRDKSNVYCFQVVP